MKKIRQIIFGFCVVLSITALTIVQAAQVPLKINASTVQTKPQQKSPCVMSTSNSKLNADQHKPAKGADINKIAATMKRWDRDCDGISDYYDNCIDVYNPRQTDRNKNEIGDVCEQRKHRKRKALRKNKKLN